VEKPIRILGVGNVLVGDDGLGPYVANVLEARYIFPERVEVLDVGTPGLDFTPYLENAAAVIVIDTVSSDGPPGSLRVYRTEDLLAKPPPARTNPHQPGLREAMMAAELTDTGADEIVVVGVIPESTEAVPGLSDTLRDSVENVVATVLRELERLGVSVTRREPPLALDIWWE
jgi:hydrogenase maturation protease